MTKGPSRSPSQLRLFTDSSLIRNLHVICREEQPGAHGCMPYAIRECPYRHKHCPWRPVSRAAPAQAPGPSPSVPWHPHAFTDPLLFWVSVSLGLAVNVTTQHPAPAPRAPSF